MDISTSACSGFVDPKLYIFLLMDISTSTCSGFLDSKLFSIYSTYIESIWIANTLIKIFFIINSFVGRVLLLNLLNFFLFFHYFSILTRRRNSWYGSKVAQLGEPSGSQVADSGRPLSRSTVSKLVGEVRNTESWTETPVNKQSRTASGYPATKQYRWCELFSRI